MKDSQSLIAGSSFHVGSLGSFRKLAEITPEEFSTPAGPNAVPIEAAASFRRNTGRQWKSAANRITCEAVVGTPAKTRISAPDRFRIETCSSIYASAL